MAGLSWGEEFVGRRVVITGACGIYGRWIAKAFADVGAECDLDATSEGMTVNGGDHRDRHLLPRPRDLLAEMGDPSVDHRPRVAVLPGAIGDRSALGGAARHRLERGEVEPGAERGALS